MSPLASCCLLFKTIFTVDLHLIVRACLNRNAAGSLFPSQIIVMLVISGIVAIALTILRGVWNAYYYVLQREVF